MTTNMPVQGDEKILAGVTFRYDGNTWLVVGGPLPERHGILDSDYVPTPSKPRSSRLTTRGNDVARVDAVEAAVILGTLGGCLWFFALLTMIHGAPMLASLVNTTTLIELSGAGGLIILGGMALIGAIVVGVLAPTR